MTLKLLNKLNELKYYSIQIRNLSINSITKENLESYDKNGFFVIKNLVSAEKLEKFKNRFIKICIDKIRVPGMTIMKDIAIAKSDFSIGEKAVTKIQDFCGDDELFEYCCLPEITTYVKSIIGPNLMAIHTMLINKPSDPGTLSSRHPLHQDLYYFPFRPADKIIAVWTAMEKVDKNNGCLFVIPGSQKGELLQHEYPKWEGGVNKMYYGVKGIDMNKVKLVHLEMEKGDTVFFHPLLLHGSGPNLTNGFRKAISCHYAASECQFIDVVGTVQESFKKEVETLANKKFGLPKDKKIDINEIWKLKSRLVWGKRINL